jgi:hypothetical protein
MGWYTDGGFTIRQATNADGERRFRVTFYGAEPAGVHRYAAQVTKTDLLGMRIEITRALRQAKEER